MIINQSKMEQPYELVSSFILEVDGCVVLVTYRVIVGIRKILNTWVEV